MNKFGMVLGVAAVATLAGCKDPDYKYGDSASAQNEVKAAEAQPVEIEPAPAPKDIVVAPAEKPIEIKADVSKPAAQPLAVTPVVAPAVAAETTTYVVQKGDVLSKIAKKYNLKVSDIRKLNPKIKKDVIWVGMKIKLPGKVDVGPQAQSAAVVSSSAKGAKSSAPYTGATKEYVVKSGDTLGAIAYGNGINIRQLKELNGLKSDVIRVGQKLKIPAAKASAGTPVKEGAKTAGKPAANAVKSAPEKKPVAATAVKPVEPTPPPAAADNVTPAAAPVDEKPVAAPAPAPAAPAAESTGGTYIVQDGDDMTGVSIRWGVSAAAIRELNNLPDDAQLMPGQVLKLPADAQQ